MAYSPDQIPETALLKVVNYLFLPLNKGSISVLALLDFSSAVDTIDHSILVHRPLLTLDLLMLSFNGFLLISLIVQTTSLYVIIVLLLPM